MIRVRSMGLVVLFAIGCAGDPGLPPPPVAPGPAPAVAPVAGPEPFRLTPDAPFRDHMPAPDPGVTFVPPKIVSFTLKNGVRVLLVERHELPIVSVRAVIKGGAGDLAGARPGVVSFVGAMLEQGTQKRTALQISDEYEAIGAAHSAWVDWDSAGASVKVMASELDAALDLLGDVLLHASFPADEIDRLKARRLSALQAEKNSPGAEWSNSAAPALFGRAHPYGHSLSGQVEDVQKIQRAELVKAYSELIVPGRAGIVVAGDVTKDVLAKKLEASLGGWKAAAAAPLTPPRVPPSSKDSPRIVIVDRPGAPQSVVRLAEVGVARSAPDRDAIAVMNVILGGMFSSRINLNLREAHAYTYGASSGFQMRHGAGHFSAGGNIVSDKTVPAIVELFKELNAMRDNKVLDEELATAKENLKLAMPGRFETVSEVTGAVADVFAYDLPLDEYATAVARIEKVTADDVLKAAKAHLHPQAIKVIVVGDRSKIEPSLEPLHLGPVEARDPYGDPVTASAPTVTPSPPTRLR